jgi:hypothetical protein
MLLLRRRRRPTRPLERRSPGPTKPKKTGRKTHPRERAPIDQAHRASVCNVWGTNNLDSGGPPP